MQSQDRTRISLYKGQPHELSFPWISVVIYMLAMLLAPFVSEYLFIITFALQCYRLLRYDIRVCSIDMALTIPFASFYRLPGGFSYIVIYLFLFIITFLSKRAKLYLVNGLILLLATVIYLALRTDGQWELLIFIVCGLLFLYLEYFEFQNEDHNSILCAFVIGTLVASVYAYIFRENEMVRAIILRGAEVNLSRFRGLFPDPNYYATFLVFAMISLMCLDMHKHINRFLYFGSFAAIIFFGVQTSSKSFVLMLLVILVYYGVNMFAQRKYFVGILLLIMIAFFTIWAIEGKIEWLDAVLQRFENSEDMNELTTGRTDIWKRYSDYIFADIGTMLFGEGLNAPLVGSEGTHNIFLESVYYLGIIGLILLISFTIAVIRQIKQKMETNSKAPFLRFLPILAILLMYFFLQGISSILFYLSLFIMYECYACCISKRPEVA